MQFVDPAHERQVLGRDQARSIIDRAAADVENLRAGLGKLDRTLSGFSA
jgi:hypothetical protein